MRTTKQPDPPFDINSLMAGIMRVESGDDKYMINPTSTATGRYGQLFSEIEGLAELDGMTREQFAEDIGLQDQIFMMRAEGMIPGIPGLIDSAIDLTREYSDQIEDFDFRPDEVAALTNFLGRQGTRNYFASLRDGTEYKVPGVNKTPEEYLEKYNEGVREHLDREQQPHRTVDTDFKPIKNDKGGRVVKYQHGGKHDGGDKKKPGDVVREPEDPSQEVMNEMALNRREFEAGRGAQRFGSRPDPRTGIQQGGANPYYIKKANEYYQDVYSDPEVIAKIAEQIHIPYPDSFSQRVGDYIYDNYDYLGSILASNGFMPTALNDHRLDDLEHEYPDAGVYDNPRTKEEADQKALALAELLARRRRDIMSSNSDRFFMPDSPTSRGYTFPHGSIAGQQRSPYWMGLSTIQDRGVEGMQVDNRYGVETQTRTTTHEMSHAQDRGGHYLTDGFIDYVDQNRKPFMEADVEETSGYQYLTRPTEVMARLNEVRENMYRRGGYRSFSDIPVLEKMQFVNTPAFQQLLQVFGDEQVTEMLDNYYAQGGRVSDKIRVLKKEGKPQKQAVAIALDMLERGKL